MENKFSQLVNIGNDVPKYKRIYTIFKEAFETSLCKPGDSIPSINAFSKKYKISRDTVFKAYSLLKENGLISATPNKGYYIADGKKLIFKKIEITTDDSYTFYKEYDSKQ